MDSNNIGFIRLSIIEELFIRLLIRPLDFANKSELKRRPICRTVADAVHVLDAIVGYDALDAAATKAASKNIPQDGYKQFLKIEGLNGKRIGIPNGFFDFTDGTERQIVHKQHLNTMR